MNICDHAPGECHRGCLIKAKLIQKEKAMSEDKLTVGNVTFSVERAGERMVDTVYVGDLPDFRQLLAARLGCDVDKVTVENLVNAIGAAQAVYRKRNSYSFDHFGCLEKALAPFKREVG